MEGSRTVARLAWDQVPTDVRSVVEDRLRASVSSAVSQETGFSPGVAARCGLSDGRRVFVKAVADHVNAESAAMARHEIAVNDVLGTLAATGSWNTPRLLTTVDDGGWVVAVFEDVAGRHPGSPWTAEDLSAVVDHLGRIRPLQVPDGAPVGAMRDRHTSDFDGWRRLAALDAPPSDLEPWIDRSVLEHLAAVEATWPDHAPPDALIHSDVRADNLLLDERRTVWTVDWANAVAGPPWFDLLGMIPSVAMEGGVDPEDLWASSSWADRVDPVAVTAMVVALAGYFTASARRPPVPTIPMLRTFQELQGVPARAWAAQRLGLRIR